MVLVLSCEACRSRVLSLYALLLNSPHATPTKGMGSMWIHFPLKSYCKDLAGIPEPMPDASLKSPSVVGHSC